MIERVRASRRTGPGSLRRRDTGQSVVEFALIAPIMVVILLLIVDVARVYTTMMSVESAAREAADYGTTLGAGKWQPSAMDETLRKMQERSCVASQNLPDYHDTDVPPDPANGCANPAFAYCVTPDVGDPCGPVDPDDGCDVATRPEPCTVTVTLSYDFHLIVPLNIEMFGVRFGFPSTVTLQRDSTFAMTDITVSAPPP